MFQERRKKKCEKEMKKAYSKTTVLILDVHKTHLKNTKCAASKPRCAWTACTQIVKNNIERQNKATNGSSKDNLNSNISLI